MFFFHWKEESQHAILDELEWRREDAQLSAEARDRAVDDLIALVAGIDAMLQAQAAADTHYFVEVAGRPFDAAEVAAIGETTLRAYRWQYIVSGVSEPRFAKILSELITPEQGERMGLALAPLLDSSEGTRHGSDRDPISLQRGNVVRILRGQGTRVMAARGMLWVSEEGSPTDYVLMPGDTVTLQHAGKALVLAVSAARAFLETPHGVAPPRVVEIAPADGSLGDAFAATPDRPSGSSASVTKSSHGSTRCSVFRGARGLSPAARSAGRDGRWRSDCSGLSNRQSAHEGYHLRFGPKPQTMAAAKQEIRFCTSHDGVRIAYARSGQGPPLVKVANWLSHIEFDWESPVWRPLLTELSRDHTLIRYDERGCGLSDWNVADLSFEAWVRDLETVVNAAERGPLPASRHLAGCLDRGGVRGASSGARQPPDPARRLRAGPAAARRDTAAARGGRDDEQARRARLGAAESRVPAILHDAVHSRRLARAASLVQRARAHLDVAGERRDGSCACSTRSTSSTCCRRSACPTLVLHSSRDARVSFDEGRLIAGLIPGARFVPLEGDNHLLLDSEPSWQRWLDELRTFLPPVPRADRVFAALTPRERGLLELIAQGRDNAQIAAKLGLSEKTVRNHITSIFAKLEVDNRARAIVLARDAGFGSKLQ